MLYSIGYLTFSRRKEYKNSTFLLIYAYFSSDALAINWTDVGAPFWVQIEVSGWRAA